MVTLGSLTACNTTTPYQSSSVYHPTVTGPGVETGIMISAIGGLYTSSVYGLDRQQKMQQSAAVHTALESEYGRVVSWYDRDAMGHVKAVHGYPQGRGYCKVIYSAVTVRGRTKEFTETACQNYYDSRGWKFVQK
jgi:surface antigen